MRSATAATWRRPSSANPVLPSPVTWGQHPSLHHNSPAQGEPRVLGVEGCSRDRWLVARRMRPPNPPGPCAWADPHLLHHLSSNRRFLSDLREQCPGAGGMQAAGVSTWPHVRVASMMPLSVQGGPGQQELERPRAGIGPPPRRHQGPPTGGFAQARMCPLVTGDQKSEIQGSACAAGAILGVPVSVCNPSSSGRQPGCRPAST